MSALILLGAALLSLGGQVLYAAPKGNAQMEAQAPKAVNLNKATAEELVAISGIGPALADRIIQYRTEHGPFAHVDDLNNVRGIGEAKFQKTRSQITV